MVSTHQKPVPVPPPALQPFENGIAHPELWLWDSWTTELDGVLYLQCLALSRRDSAGNPIDPSNRNDYPFHIRSFQSSDGGLSWMDKGVFLLPVENQDGALERNVWSGAIVARRNEPWLAGFTGIRNLDAERPFLQTICIGQSANGSAMDWVPAAALSCPLRDYNQIRNAGYYLAPKDELGAADGEEGGPILAWRDPFILDAGNSRLEVFWSAKVSPARPAIAHATVRQHGDAFRIETLHPPILLPDDKAFTQAEVPKIYCDPDGGLCYMLISACDRLNESQPADEVTKCLRLYTSASIRGPWIPAFGDTISEVPGTNNLFGGSILRADFKAGRLTLIAPYSEYASNDLQLTFPAVRSIELPRQNVSAGRSSI